MICLARTLPTPGRDSRRAETFILPMTSFSWPCLMTSWREAPECLSRFLTSARSRRAAAAFSSAAARCSGVRGGRATPTSPRMSNCRIRTGEEPSRPTPGEQRATRLPVRCSATETSGQGRSSQREQTEKSWSASTGPDISGIIAPVLRMYSDSGRPAKPSRRRTARDGRRTCSGGSPTAARISSANRSADVAQRGDVGTVPQHAPADARHHVAHRRAEDPGKVGRGRALGADAGGEQRAVDVQVVRPTGRRAWRRRPRRRSRAAPRPRSRRPGGPASVAPTVRPSARDGALDLGALRVGGQRQHEEPGAARARQRRARGRSEPKPRYGRDGQRVREQRRVLVAGRSSAYAAMVEPMSPRLASIRTSAPAARASSTAFSRTAMPREPKRSKNARLRLEDGDPVGQRLDDRAA